MDFGDLDALLGLEGETGPLMMLVWILPVIVLVFYGQRIQLQITSGEIKKGIKKLDAHRAAARRELMDHVGPMGGDGGPFGRFLEYFVIPPSDLDPGGIVPKIRHTVRAREEYTRRNIRSALGGATEADLNAVQALVEVAASLDLLYKTTNHMYLTAKKQNNYPLILPLQMALPFIMEEAAALKEAVSAFKQCQPVGDGIGPMVVGKMMLNSIKEEIAYQTVLARSEYEGRKLLLVKAQGPSPTVGRPADALESLAGSEEIGAIVMVDAALKLEGEESASVAQGFGAAIGGTGTERFVIEAAAAGRGIPVFSIVVRQSVKEALSLMSEEIAGRAGEVEGRVHDVIRSNTEPGQAVMVIGVGNTSGVGQ